MTDQIDDGEVVEVDDTDLEPAIRAEDEAAEADPVQPAEEGPRRRVLAVLAAVVGAVLLWMLFRSVPETSEPAEAGSQESGSRAGTVESMANASDPSWMQNPDPPGTPRREAGGVVPPVFGPGGAGARGYEESSVAGGAPPVPPDSGNVAPAAAADPRREAFLAALRSRPVQSGGVGTGVGRPEESAEAAIAEPPSLAEMDAAAQAEAARRSASIGGAGFTVDASTPGSTFGLGADARAVTSSQRSSYVTGGVGQQPQAAEPQRLTPLSAAASRESLSVPIGTVIEGQLHTALSSDLPGNVLGMVTRPVYDASQRVVVIPRFSWLFGTYESDVAAGQARLVVQWTAIRFPNGETYALPALRAGDRMGASGLQGNVNNHYGRLFGQALLSSVVAAGFSGGSATSTEGQSSRDAMAQGVSQRLGETAAEVTRRNLNIKPTITVPRLTRFAIILDRELTFTSPPRP